MKARDPEKLPIAPRPRLTSREAFALAFGLFLGLALLKFGNPVILDSKITPPEDASEFWWFAWPPSWAMWFLAPLAFWGAGLALKQGLQWPASRWLWLLPSVWFGWQLISATQTVDEALTSATLIQFAGVIVCYGMGAVLFRGERMLHLLLLGLLAGFVLCLVRATDQKLIEFPREKQFLIEGDRAGWTNVPPDLLLQLQQENIVLTAHGVDVANPAILAKYEKGRVHGTLVYPNALAGVILLLAPIAMALAFGKTRPFRLLTRVAVIALTLFLIIGSLYWTGSKSGWLIALVLAGGCLFRLDWPTRMKWLVLAVVILAGLSVFAVRFHDYFATGAKSVGARFDYWGTALQAVKEHPITGSGPGTFQRPYERLKPPEAEMARLAHNDYLQQFSDSGLPGGFSYVSWILLLLWTVFRRLWDSPDWMLFALFLGVFGWFVQGLSEFSLYIPALAWTAFAISGALLGLTANSANAVPRSETAGQR